MEVKSNYYSNICVNFCFFKTNANLCFKLKAVPLSIWNA